MEPLYPLVIVRQRSPLLRLPSAFGGRWCLVNSKRPEMPGELQKNTMSRKSKGLTAQVIISLQRVHLHRERKHFLCHGCRTAKRLFSSSPIAARTADRPVTFV